MRRPAWAVRAVVVLALVAGPSQASATAPDQDDGGWSRVERIQAGKQVIIGVAGRQPLTYTLLAAHDSGLVVVKPSDNEPDDAVMDALIAVGSDWPDILAGRPVAKGSVEIESGGIYRKGKKLMDLGSVVERIDRATVTEVRGPHTKSAGDPSGNAVSQQAVIGAIIGGGIGFAAGAAIGSGGPYCGEVGECNRARTVPMKGAVGAAIGALVGVARAYAVGDEHATFYVAPKKPAPALDDVPWERLRLGLPPSLQGAGAAQRPEANIRPSTAPSAGGNQ